jgi:hypothetical protein
MALDDSPRPTRYHHPLVSHRLESLLGGYRRTEGSVDAFKVLNFDAVSTAAIDCQLSDSGLGVQSKLR